MGIGNLGAAVPRGFGVVAMYHILTLDKLGHASKTAHSTLDAARRAFEQLDRRFYPTAMLTHNDTILAR